mgnify:CR=1 FL=1
MFEYSFGKPYVNSVSLSVHIKILNPCRSAEQFHQHVNSNKKDHQVIQEKLVSRYTLTK